MTVLHRQGAMGQDRCEFCGMVGRSPVMRQVYETTRKVAAADVGVLVVGETGTGKELVARAVHRLSDRRHGPFVAQDCGAIPAEIMESEFFGHERGAFTGAHASTPGLLESACRGILFLDEINGLSPLLQAKLLRVLEERRMRRVGGGAEIELNIRVVAASSTDLTAQVRLGRFREDLYHRINVARIDLPPLRDRKEDIPLLADYFCASLARELKTGRKSISPEAMEVLANYWWPGNVRELANLLKRMITMATGQVIGLGDLPREVSSSVGPGYKVAHGYFSKCAEFQTEYLRILMKVNRGNVGAAASEADLVEGTLYRLLKEHGLNARGFRADV